MGFPTRDGSWVVGGEGRVGEDVFDRDEDWIGELPRTVNLDVGRKVFNLRRSRRVRCDEGEKKKTDIREGIDPGCLEIKLIAIVFDFANVRLLFNAFVLVGDEGQ